MHLSCKKVVASKRPFILYFVLFVVRILTFSQNQRKCTLFFDKRGHPASVCSGGPSSRPTNWSASALQTSQNELSVFLVRSALQTSDQPGTFKYARTRSKTRPFIRNVEKISRPKRSIKITDHFTCTSADVIYCITFTLCIGETRRRLGDRFREHLRDAEEHAKDASKSVAGQFNLPNNMYSTKEKQHPTTL